MTGPVSIGVVPYEVEVKLSTELDPVRPRLRAAGFERVAEVRQVDRYFDAPHRDLAVTDEAVRVRTVEPLDSDSPSSHLSYKGPRVGSDGPGKSRLERAVGVADASTMVDVLVALDFTPVGTVRKRRERFERGSTVVALDDVEGAGTFVEIERVVSPERVDATETDLRSVIPELALTEAPAEERTYLELVLDNAW